MKELYRIFGKAEKEVEGMLSIANIFHEMGQEEDLDRRELTDEELQKLLLK